MAFPRLEADMNNVQTLQNITKNQAGAVKILFDKAGNDIKTYLTTLINELESLEAAGSIGIEANNISAETVKGAIEELKQLITNAEDAIQTNNIAIDNILDTLVDVNYSIVSIEEADQNLANSVDTLGNTVSSAVSSMNTTVANAVTAVGVAVEGMESIVAAANTRMDNIDVYTTVAAAVNIFMLDAGGYPTKNFRIAINDTTAKGVVFEDIADNCDIFLELSFNAVAAITWPAGITWLNGIPLFTAGKKYRLMFFTSDAGNHWNAAAIGGW